LFLLGTITLFLLTGAAWGQSLTPTPSGPNQPLQSDKEDVKPSPEGQRELPLKDLREQPVKTQEDQAGKTQEEKAGKPLKKPYPDKPKSRVSRGKRPGAGKPASEAYQDPFTPKDPVTPKDMFTPRTKSDWWPPQPEPDAPFSSSLEGSLRKYLEKDSSLEGSLRQDPEKDSLTPRTKSDWLPPQPGPDAPFSSSLGGSLRKYPEKDSPTDEDEDADEEKREELENLPQGRKKLIKPPIGLQDTEQEED
jgi:hypothetical protein